MTENSQHNVANQTADVSAIIASINHFAIDLYRSFSRKETENLFFAPNSVMQALAMTFAGASGDTAQEMADALRFSLPSQRIHEAFRELLKSTNTNGIEFRNANRLWGQCGYHFLPEFLATTEQCYQARLAEVDFQSATEAVRQQINEWIENQTAHKIKDLIPSGMLDKMSRLVLTNAVYFLGRWMEEFNELRTKDAPFWTTATEQSQLPMMYQLSNFSYGDFDDLQVLEMPYCYPSSVVMTILLPRKIDGLAGIESDLSTSMLVKWTSLKSCRVEVGVPKFRIESSFRLTDSLIAIGIRKAFSIMDADFSRMSDDPAGLYISAVLHKSFVDVNEKGTEAAAATAMLVRAAAAIRQQPPQRFIADHPFLFMIRDKKNGLIHFMGRMTGVQ